MAKWLDPWGREPVREPKTASRAPDLLIKRMGRSGLLATVLLIAVLASLLASAAAASGSAGVVSAWGDNTYGELGNGTEGWGTASKVPTQTGDLSGVQAISAGLVHGLALLEDGTVKGWGANGAGALGDGTIADRNSPVSVQGLTGVTAIAGGEGHSLALLDDGTVMAWGRNDKGQLGLGTISGPETCMSGLPCSTTPVQVKGLSGVIAIATAYDHNLALLDDGTVMAWGQNFWGELGTGTTGPNKCGDGWLCNPTPTRVAGLSGVTAIATGHSQSLALLEDGTVMAWGYNDDGILGVGTSSGPETCGEVKVACTSTPMAVHGLSEVTAIATGWIHNLALLEDGTVRAWGYNSNGQLGDGTNVDRDTPVPVSGLSGVTALGAGSYHSLALLEDGTVRAWGWNLMWTLGNNSVEDESRTPVPVTGLIGVTAIAGSNMNSYALGDPPATFPNVSRIEPHAGPPAGGTEVTITGTGFSNVFSVKFGSTEAAGFTVQSDTSITAISPPGTGTVGVTVEDARGSSYTRGSTYFSYEAPSTELPDPEEPLPPEPPDVHPLPEKEPPEKEEPPIEDPAAQPSGEETSPAPPAESPVITEAADGGGQQAAGALQGSGSTQIWSCVAPKGGSAARVCTMKSAPATASSALNDSRGLSVKLMRGGELYATGSAALGRTKTRLELSPIKRLTPGRYSLKFTRRHRQAHELVVLR